MAVQILNDMPDAAVHRGDPAYTLLAQLNSPRKRSRSPRRAGFMAATLVLHVIAAVAFMNLRHEQRAKTEPGPIMATMIDAPRSEADAAPMSEPPMIYVAYAMSPPEVSFENDAPAPEIATAAIAIPQPQTSAAPVVAEIDYVRAPAPVYPNESRRKRERGTVLLRVLVDTQGRPAQIDIERSSGYDRLDGAAREAVQKALFRPHEIDGIARPAQVLIPIEFLPRAT
jgi:periplasmic protein TonB